MDHLLACTILEINSEQRLVQLPESVADERLLLVGPHSVEGVEPKAKESIDVT